MNRAGAVALVVAMVAATTVALAAPILFVALLAAVGLAVVASRAFLVGAIGAAAVYATLLAATAPPGAAAAGAIDGVAAATRMTGAIAANIAVITRAGAARLIDALRLPAAPTAWIAAVALAARDLHMDAQRLRRARVVDGTWPTTRRGRLRAAARLLPALLLQSDRRATIRRDALRIAGHDTPAYFVPVVAVASLAAAGRIAFLAFPNVALTFVVVFLGGALWGARAGALGGALGMAITDFFLSGLLPTAYVNVAAMALVGAMGGWLPRRWLWADDDDGSTAGRPVPTTGRVVAAVIGITVTAVFSVASDTATWLMVPEFAGDAARWRVLVLAGLAFNVVPAFVNGFLFAATLTPVLAAWHAWQAPPSTQSPGSPLSPGPE